MRYSKVHAFWNWKALRYLVFRYNVTSKAKYYYLLLVLAILALPAVYAAACSGNPQPANCTGNNWNHQICSGSTWQWTETNCDGVADTCAGNVFTNYTCDAALGCVPVSTDCSNGAYEPVCKVEGVLGNYTCTIGQGCVLTTTNCTERVYDLLTVRCACSCGPYTATGNENYSGLRADRCSDMIDNDCDAPIDDQWNKDYNDTDCPPANSCECVPVFVDSGSGPQLTNCVADYYATTPVGYWAPGEYTAAQCPNGVASSTCAKSGSNCTGSCVCNGATPSVFRCQNPLNAYWSSTGHSNSWAEIDTNVFTYHKCFAGADHSGWMNCTMMNSCQDDSLIRYIADPTKACVQQPILNCNVSSGGKCSCSCGSFTATDTEDKISCSDGLDNDCDNAIDCADTDCFSDPWCYEDICSNNWDDERGGLGDGYADCRDYNCYSVNKYCGDSTESGRGGNNGVNASGYYYCSNVTPSGSIIPTGDRHCCLWGLYWGVATNECKPATQCYLNPGGACPFLPSQPSYWMDTDCIPGQYGGLACCPIVLGGGDPIYALQPFVIY